MPEKEIPISRQSNQLSVSYQFVQPCQLISRLFRDQVVPDAVERAENGESYLGIYLLDGDTLKWCVSTPDNERPTEFTTKGSHFLLVLTRQKDR